MRMESALLDLIAFTTSFLCSLSSKIARLIEAILVASFFALVPAMTLFSLIKRPSSIIWVIPISEASNVDLWLLPVPLGPTKAYTFIANLQTFIYSDYTISYGLFRYC